MATEKDELELRLATTLAPMLLAVSIFSLTLVERTAAPANTYVDEILSLLSTICILGATMVADSALDKVNLSYNDRFRFLGGGYLLFCVVTGVITMTIPLIYISKQCLTKPLNGWYYFIYFIAGSLASLKLMNNKEKALTISMFAFFIFSIFMTSLL